jgi:hypothetical protein
MSILLAHGNNVYFFFLEVINLKKFAIISGSQRSKKILMHIYRIKWSWYIWKDLVCLLINEQIPAAAPSNAWVCGRSFVGIAGANPDGGMDVCLLCLLDVARYTSLHRADHSSRGVQQSVMCLVSVVVKPHAGRPWIRIGSKRYKKEINDFSYKDVGISG